MLAEDEVKSLIGAAEDAIFEEMRKRVGPLWEAMRVLELDVLALKLATYQLAAVVAARYPDGQLMIRTWLETTIKMVDSISLNDSSEQMLSPELDAQIRSAIRKKLEDIATTVFENMR